MVPGPGEHVLFSFISVHIAFYISFSIRENLQSQHYELNPVCLCQRWVLYPLIDFIHYLSLTELSVIFVGSHSCIVLNIAIIILELTASFSVSTFFPSLDNIRATPLLHCEEYLLIMSLQSRCLTWIRSFSPALSYLVFLIKKC